MSNEIERIREEIGRQLALDNHYEHDWDADVPSVREKYLREANQILSIQGFCFKADDQTLPSSGYSILAAYKYAQQDMIMGDDKYYWVKVARQ